MAKAKRMSKELREVEQRRRVLSAGLDLSVALETIAKKHKLTEADLVELVKRSFDSCLTYVLNQHRSI